MTKSIHQLSYYVNFKNFYRDDHIILKSFIRLHLDYGDVIFDQAYNKLFQENLESIQYNVILVITGATRGTSKEKL